MRKIPLILKAILAYAIGILLQLTLHELGHALFALITGNNVTAIHFGMTSYAEVVVVNEWSMWVISIGCFVLPLLICFLLEAFKSLFIRMLKLVVLLATTIQLAINGIAVLCIKDYESLQTFDLGVCVISGQNNIFIGIVALFLTGGLFIWIISNIKKLVEIV